MLEALYRAIREDVPAQEITLKGRSYTTTEVEPVLHPVPSTIRVKTLTALTNYLKANVDELDIKGLICHVESPSAVSIHSALVGDFAQRASYIRAEIDQLQIKFNSYMDGEAFNILLQSCFVDYEENPKKGTDKGLVLRYCANVRQVAEGVTLDDGVTQAVTVKKGISSVEQTILPNPVTLRPYRTFTEVEQPASQFVFRAKEGPQFMLVEADGGAWKSEAMTNVKAFMEKEVPGLSVIA